MDDQHQNVIDELARARQWRRSRSKPARPTSEATKARSDAPKRIADSLLVPAHMLPAARPVDRSHADDQRSGAPQPADPGDMATDGSQPEGAGDRNVFLDPEADGAGSDGRTVTAASRRSIAALLTRLIGSMTPSQQSVRPHTSSRAMLRRMPMMRPNRPVALALASLAAIAVAAVILTRSDTPSSGLAKGSGHGAIASLLDRFTSAPLAVAANPFPAGHAVRKPATHVRRVRMHRTSTRPQARRPTRPAVRAPSPARATATVAARETPPPSATSSTPASTGTSSSTPVSSGSSSSASSGAATAPAAQHPSAPSTHVQAFGSAGALAPGSSPDG
jgi:hypothetical protein